VSKSGKRIGDVVAGTLVVREGLIHQPLPQTARPAEVRDRDATPATASLSDAELQLLERWSERRASLTPERRAEITSQVATRLRHALPADANGNDQAGLSFHDVVAEVQNGNQIVVTAEITVTGTAGKPRTGSVVFSAFMDYTDDARFMDYTDDVCMPSLMSRQAETQACAVISSALRDAAAAATAPDALITSPATPASGIIMRDGGVCDPIRHMGC